MLDTELSGEMKNKNSDEGVKTGITSSRRNILIALLERDRETETETEKEMVLKLGPNQGGVLTITAKNIGVKTRT